MKIILDGTGISNKPTGLGVYIYQLVNSLCQISTNCIFELWISTSLNNKHKIYSLDYPNLNIEKISLNSIGPLRDLKFNYYKSRITDDSIFHSLSSNFPLTFYPFKHSVATIHDLKFILHPTYLGRLYKLKTAYLTKVFNNGIKHADRIICISKSTRNDLITYYRSIDDIDQKISVVPLASALKKLPEDKNEASGNTIFDKPYFLFVGEFRPHKNIDGMISAFKKFYMMDKDNENFLFVIVGSKHASKTKFQMSDFSSEILNNIIIMEDVDDHQLVHLYNNAFALLFLSHYEGFGLPIVEAMELGKPVITSNVSSMPELVKNTDYMVDPNDHIAAANMMNRLAVDKEFYDRSVNNSLMQSKNYSWMKTASETLSVYNTFSEQ